MCVVQLTDKREELFMSIVAESTIPVVSDINWKVICINIKLFKNKWKNFTNTTKRSGLEHNTQDAVFTPVNSESQPKTTSF